MSETTEPEVNMMMTMMTMMTVMTVMTQIQAQMLQLMMMLFMSITKTITVMGDRHSDITMITMIMRPLRIMDDG